MKLNKKAVFGSKLAICFLVIWGTLSFIYHSTLTSYQDLAVNRLIDATLNRIALDIPELKLADHRFNQASNSFKVTRYIDSLNDYLTAADFPFRVLMIQDTEVELTFTSERNVTKSLLFPRQTIEVQFALMPANQNAWYWLPTILAIILSYLAIPHLRPRKSKRSDTLLTEPETPVKLTLDLTSRTLYLNITPDTKIPMANKPFCFYLAMLEYCASDKNAALYHHKSLPEEFLQLANKYFMRLMDLGHTKRKRPDFSANIDKMLSEIRNALDDVMESEAELKDKFFPKKAQGEGSRSKLNNFALSDIATDDYELVGK